MGRALRHLFCRGPIIVPELAAYPQCTNRPLEDSRQPDSYPAALGRYSCAERCYLRLGVGEISGAKPRRLRRLRREQSVRLCCRASDGELVQVHSRKSKVESRKQQRTVILHACQRVADSIQLVLHQRSLSQDRHAVHDARHKYRPFDSRQS